MGAFFLDTSALVKLYLPEKGSIWMRKQGQIDTDFTIAISQATLVEAVATFSRKARELDAAQRITIEERDRLIMLFREHVHTSYYVKKVTADIYTQAGNLCRMYPLRAYDAIQLACAQDTRQELLDEGALAPVFVTADNKLLEIAVAEGFSVENPNDHP